MISQFTVKILGSSHIIAYKAKYEDVIYRMKEHILYLTILMLFLFSTIPFYVEVANINKKILNIAHRGASGYAPENTFAAFDKALDMGVDYIEIDVQMTLDDKLVIIHDATVDRTTNGKGFVKDLTLFQMKQLDAGSWFSEEYKDQLIPTFYEFLEQYGTKVGILIEIKNPSLYPGIEKKIAKEILLYSQNIETDLDIKIQSFSLESIETIKKYLPSITSGLLVNRIVSYRELLKIAKNTNFINVHKRYINRHLVLQAHQLGLNIYAWTVNELQDLKFLLQLGIDGAIVDYPELAYQLKRVY